MDTRFWGPSGWQLFHYISFRPHSQDVLLLMKDILPCKFCRASTSQYVKEHPIHGNPGKWLYEIHNKVNNKLRTECKDDPNVIHPGEDPTFEDVKNKYENMKLTNVLGRDFLFSIAINYPENPEEIDMGTQRTFIHKLAEVYPQKEFKEYLLKYEVTLHSQKEYVKWMYGLLSHLSKSLHVPILSFKGYVARGMYYKSGCSRKTYRGKTCRRTKSGYLTKIRDNKKTFKVSHAPLL